MQQILLKRLTGLGDPTLLLCASLALFFYFWIADDRRAVGRPWAIALLMCIALVVSAKVVFYIFGEDHAGPDRLRSPSGHVAIATTFYGCVAVMLAARRSLEMRLLITAVALAVLALLATTRFMLGLHSIPEVIVAFGIGALCIIAFMAALDRRHLANVSAGHVIAILALIAVTQNVRVNGEGLVEHLATQIGHFRVAAVVMPSDGEQRNALQTHTR